MKFLSPDLRFLRPAPSVLAGREHSDTGTGKERLVAVAQLRSLLLPPACDDTPLPHPVVAYSVARLCSHSMLARSNSPEYFDRLSSPEYGEVDNQYRLESLSPTPPLAARQMDSDTSLLRHAQSDLPSAEVQDLFDLDEPLQTHSHGYPQASGMNVNLTSHSKETTRLKRGDDDVASLVCSNEKQIQLESSEDDGPIMARRKPRGQHKDSFVVHDRRAHCGRNTNDQSHERHVLRQSRKASPPKRTTTAKKSRPSAWAAKPIMKNDMKAKLQVIREIESYWGKGFIKAYIPKCHLPLVKRGKGVKRVNNRSREMDPKNWLPSILKAILMIAKLTDNKDWIKQAMNDVVRYRIKHTGNRKPQLVTTDFDVIEDMLTKQWAVHYAFSIRYKHLLENRKDEVENDEDIDHILQTGSEDQDDGEYEEDSDEIFIRKVDDEQDGDEEEQPRLGLLPDNSFHASGQSSKASNDPPPPRQRVKKPNAPKYTTTPANHTNENMAYQSQQTLYGYGPPSQGFGAPLDPWGRPMAGYPGGHPQRYDGYSSYADGYAGHVGHGVARDARTGSHGRHGFMTAPYLPTPPPPMMSPASKPNKRVQDSPANANKRARHNHEPRTTSKMPGLPQSCQPGQNIEIKRESPALDDLEAVGSDFDSPTDDLDGQGNAGDEEAALDAEMKAMEIQLKLAKMKARKLALKARK
ncbi:hypothetical protein FB567DRAFT_611228 [Paraphoma chrysanthemicola]|uniref:Uncharacterized protein n=1 Tax=Paraphoma chrysanthemicola TaxID=798071 RepID=A0A8K0VTM0_9PLEO|nr:hypothetical protein FB567DRAFT_611228 [Paraphoma chrysanthemicola]